MQDNTIAAVIIAVLLGSLVLLGLFSIPAAIGPGDDVKPSPVVANN